MTDRGTFIVDRGIFDDPSFKAEPLTEREAWLWLTAEAAFKPTTVRIDGIRYELGRGQLVHALRFIAGRWRWTEPRVRRFLKRLQNDARIDALAFAKATRITICNYEEIGNGRRARDALGDAANDAEKKLRLKEDSDGGGDARAREAEPSQRPSISQPALDFADELARICGLDPQFLPPQWVSAGPAVRVQLMLDSGWQIPVMREAAKATMRRKRDGAPGSIRYFEKIFSRAHAPQLPLPAAQIVSSQQQEVSHGETAASQAGDWRSRRDQQHTARAKLRAFVDAHADDAGDPGGEGDGPVVRLVPAARRR